MELPSALFSLSPQNFSIKKFLIFFPKKSTLKKFLTFSQKSPQFSGNRNPEKVLIFQEVELCYISERYIRNPNIFRTLTYLEPWHIQNYGICRTRDIFRTLSNIYDGMFCKNSYLAHFLIFREMELYSLSVLKKQKKTL